jgi:flagellar biosynthesis GTPase FlhF
MGRSFEDDPLTLALQPPVDETPEERAARERDEAAARKVSDAIDEQIRTEKVRAVDLVVPAARSAHSLCNRLQAAQRKQKKPVKVLLLGQSESGKSTTLKSVCLARAQPQSDSRPRSWRRLPTYVRAQSMG